MIHVPRLLQSESATSATAHADEVDVRVELVDNREKVAVWYGYNCEVGPESSK